MKERGETNYALAKAIGVSQSTVANWVSGATEPMRVYVEVLNRHYESNFTHSGEIIDAIHKTES